MKVLFVVSGNKEGLSPIFQNQYNSLKPLLTSTKIYQVTGKGAIGYLRNIKSLRKTIKEFKPDLIHAHYSFCGILASLATKKCTVVSLMGSDVKGGGFFNHVLRFFQKKVWDMTIVKSLDMKKTLGSDDAHVIPNGVDLELFKPFDQTKCRSELSWNSSQIHLLFAANDQLTVKNYELFEKSVALIRKEHFELSVHVLKKIPNEKVPNYFNAADVVCLTSKWEGSPNVIKEAMACNRPIVATDVGDIAWLFGDEPGHYLAGFKPEELAAQIMEAINYSKNRGHTNGRKRLKDLELESQAIASKLLSVYASILEK